MTEIKNTSVIDFTDISDEEMNKMIDGTLADFDEGDLVDGTVVKIEHDEVLVDIGFKSEGVIPVRELSIRKDADPSEIVSLGDKIEALVLQKEDKDGRLILSKKRAEYERAWISVEEKFKAGETVTGDGGSALLLRECGAERARNGVIEKGCGKDAENNRQRLSEACSENDGKEHRFVADFRGGDNARGEQYGLEGFEHFPGVGAARRGKGNAR